MPRTSAPADATQASVAESLVGDIYVPISQVGPSESFVQDGGGDVDASTRARYPIEYPVAALRAGVAGTVTVLARYDANGTVMETQIHQIQPERRSRPGCASRGEKMENKSASGASQAVGGQALVEVRFDRRSGGVVLSSCNGAILPDAVISRKRSDYGKFRSIPAGKVRGVTQHFRSSRLWRLLELTPCVFAGNGVPLHRGDEVPSFPRPRCRAPPASAISRLRKPSKVKLIRSPEIPRPPRRLPQTATVRWIKQDTDVKPNQ